MTNSKTTKRALLSSTLALLMCVAMLIGTTFAWFTDTASTAVNKIQAGTLDVALEMATAWDSNGKPIAWENAENKTLSFRKAATASESEQILWEPGCEYKLPELRIKNAGNLALKFKVIVTGITGDAKLNEVIDWYYNCYYFTDEYGFAYGSQGEQWADISNSELNIGDLDELRADQEESGIFRLAGDPVIRIKGHMQETANNDYQGLSIDGISVTVVATQATVESDSNNNQYDAEATYPIVNTSADASAEAIDRAISEALASGSDKLTLNVNSAATEETVTLNATTLQKIDNLTVNLGENVVLDVKDHSRGENDIRARYILQDGQTLKVTGKGKIGSSDYFGACGGATLIIENEGGFEQNGIGNAMINVAAHGANVVIRNYTMSNTYSVHPLITVGDGISVDNGKTEPSKITLENVTMSNFYFDESAPSVKTAGGMGIWVFKGSVDVTTSNVTFNGSSVLTSERCPNTADNAFLAIRNVTGNAATLNGESK